MAKATRKKADPIPPPDRILLDLSVEEAQFIADVLACVRGCRHKSRRRVQQSVSEELLRVGIDFTTDDITGAIDVKGGDK